MRSRNLKPGFFKNEHLAACSPFARLLFAGLWCIADREGRLEDRPKRIRAEIFPYEDHDVDKLLDELAGRCFIVRYRVGRKRYIQVTTFGTHQHPHIKEAPSTIPAPDKHQTSTHLGDVEPGVNPLTDSLLLIPDSGHETRAPAREARPVRSVPKPAKKPHEPDPWFEQVCLGVYRKAHTLLTASERAKAQKPALELRDMGVDPSEIARRCETWRTHPHWKDLTISAPALVTNWTALGNLAETNGSTNGDDSPAARREQERAERAAAFAQAGIGRDAQRDAGAARTERPAG